MERVTKVFGPNAGFLLLLAIFTGAGALKDVAVTVPLAVKSMDTVTLQCKYNLEGEPLYTVKWYKGQQEFYRYIPKELPNTQVFPLPGINVDLSKSTPNEVVLRHVQPEVTGRYKCEVSTDAPNFYTQIMSGYMYVVDIPEDDPKMEVEKEVLEYGYLVRGNCISPSSFPPANVSWYLNGIKMNESHLKRVSVDSHYVMAAKNRRTPVKTVSYLDIEIDDNMFQGGVARLQCVATLFNLYRGDDSRFIEDDRPKPRPSSVLGTPDKSSARSLAAEDCFIVLLLSALLLR